VTDPPEDLNYACQQANALTDLQRQLAELSSHVLEEKQRWTGGSSHRLLWLSLDAPPPSHDPQHAHTTHSTPTRSAQRMRWPSEARLSARQRRMVWWSARVPASAPAPLLGNPAGSPSTRGGRGTRRTDPCRVR
jgi:hypothetical protein